MEAKPPKFTLYKYHSSQGIIMENTNKAYVYRSFISIIFPFPAFWFILQRKNVSILYKYHISRTSTESKSLVESKCRSFISIIFPKNGIWNGIQNTIMCRSFISIIFSKHSLKLCPYRHNRVDPL